MNGPQIHNWRVDWVDYARGFCIIFVVMMHSTLGVEAAVGHGGWLPFWLAPPKRPVLQPAE
jgi:uncharacterized membrane protein YcfT